MQNVILVTLDCVRPDYLSCYNPDSPASTPFLGQLAARSAVFEQAVSTFGATMISVASILSGCGPVRTGCVALGKEYIRPLREDGPMLLAEMLGRCGVQSAGFTSVSLLAADMGYARGFDSFECLAEGVGDRRVNAAELTDHALAWLKGRDGPWFLWLHYFDAHVLYRPPEPYASSCVHPYAGAVAYMDGELERLFARIDLDATVAVVTADHGESLGEHDVFLHGNMYEENLRVPLLFATPGREPVRVAGMVRTIDIVPTLLEVLGVDDWPPSIEGVSLVTMMDNPEADPGLTAYCGTAVDDGTIYAAIRTPQFKLIIDSYSPRVVDPKGVARTLRRQKRARRVNRLKNLVRPLLGKPRRELELEPPTRRFLFDLERDPRENINLLGMLRPYVKGIGMKVLPHKAFPGLPWDRYREVAAELETDLRAYLATGVPASGIGPAAKADVIDRLRALGYVD